MAKSTKTTRTSSSSASTFSLNKFSFWIVIVIGVAMAVSGFFNFFNWEWVKAFSAWVQSICFLLGMFVPVVLSYRAARAKQIGLFILWIVCVVLVAFGLISNLVSLIKLF